MSKRIWLALLCVLISLLLLSGSALAQTYLFSLDRETVNVFWNEDGTMSIDYVFTFTNDPSASPLDYVDVGVPNANYDRSTVYADVDGQPVASIEDSPYVKPGIAVGLGANAIQPGDTGQVHVFIGTVRNVLREDSASDEYASGVFSPTWFGEEFVRGETDLEVIFHFPPEVQPEEPRWHEPPSGWASEPETGFDDQGRIIYSWRNTRANGYTQYRFGASFPSQYIPASAIYSPGLLERLGISGEDLVGFTVCGGIIAFIALVIGLSVYGSQRRKLQYLPPKVSIEGHGIKRGLTAVEAAVLLEEPMDKILTMILFGVIKKGAASVVTRDPLKLNISPNLPDSLQSYETSFLESFQEDKKLARRNRLQETMIDLVKSVSNKMKGFSHRETVAYYRDIMNRAWSQVEEADTPEVKSQKYEEALEWTMLDRDYEDRTRRVFRTGPVYVPIWWHNYDPSFGRGSTNIPTSAPSAPGGGGMTLPNLPGADFAASMVQGVQNFSSDVVGNVSEFTGRITDKTNPVPVSTSRSGGSRSGGGCACACACAGCACACAGGGR